MRFGLNESRQDRFLTLYESNHSNLHKNIRNWGTNVVSKSIDPCRGGGPSRNYKYNIIRSSMDHKKG